VPSAIIFHFSGSLVFSLTFQVGTPASINASSNRFPASIKTAGSVQSPAGSGFHSVSATRPSRGGTNCDTMHPIVIRRDLADEFAEILGFSEISVDRGGTDKGDLVEHRQRLHHQFAHHVADPRCNTSIATMIRNQVSAASLSPRSFRFRTMSARFRDRLVATPLEMQARGSVNVGIRDHHDQAVSDFRRWRIAVAANHSFSFDHRRRPETLRTAMATDFFWPTKTTRRFPRVTPV